MLTLSEAPVFLNEVQKFQERIDQISNTEAAVSCNNLLQKLITTVKKVDELHGQLAFEATSADRAPEARQDIAVIRKTLDKKLKELRV
jgi:hypothetical protein|tara:strand:- start:1223 stop:1486 length:264 start_codon:yes stop_codon:yes gene_type:complete